MSLQGWCVSSCPLWVPRVVGVCVFVLGREAEVLPTWELCSLLLLTWWAPPGRGGVVGAVHESFLCLQCTRYVTSREPGPPSRDPCSLSAAKMEKHVPCRVCCCFQCLPRTFPCAVTALLRGAGGAVLKGTYCSHFNLCLRALV